MLTVLNTYIRLTLVTNSYRDHRKLQRGRMRPLKHLANHFINYTAQDIREVWEIVRC